MALCQAKYSSSARTHKTVCPRTDSGATEMAKQVKCPSVLQAWGPKFASHMHLDMMAHICNSSSPTVRWETEAGKFLEAHRSAKQAWASVNKGAASDKMEG